MLGGKFKLRQSKRNQKWYWKLVARNGETIAVSEPYNSKQSALNGISSIRKNALFAKVVEE